MKDTYTLKVIESFSCTGSQCPRTCCTGWQIEVETDLLEKWRAIPDAGEREGILNILPEGVDGESQVLMHEDDLRCPFLDKDDLCKIQIKHDQSYIPTTCREYPRINVETAYRGYQTASLSCPEIVRLVLFDKHMESPYDVFRLQPDQFKQQDSHAEVNYSLDKFVDNILNQDKFPLGLRLFYMTHFFSDFFEHVQHSEIKPAQIDGLNNQIKQTLYDANLSIKQKKIKVDPVTAGSYWKSIYSLCLSRDIDKVFMEDETSSLTKVIENSGDTHDDYIKIYEMLQGYIKHSRPILSTQYRKLLKTYIQVYFKNNGFPLAPRDKTTSITLVQCMTGLSMLQLLLWMQLKNKNTIEDSFLQELIVEVQRKYAHNLSTVNYLEENSHMLQIGLYNTCFIDLF